MMRMISTWSHQGWCFWSCFYQYLHIWGWCRHSLYHRLHLPLDQSRYHDDYCSHYCNRRRPVSVELIFSMLWPTTVINPIKSAFFQTRYTHDTVRESSGLGNLSTLNNSSIFTGCWDIQWSVPNSVDTSAIMQKTDHIDTSPGPGPSHGPGSLVLVYWSWF